MNVIIMNTDNTPRIRCNGQRTLTSCLGPPAYIAQMNTTGNAARPRSAATCADG